jgi:hypothetical protein
MVCSWNPFELHYFFRLKNVLNIFLELLIVLTTFCYFLLRCLIFHRVHVGNANHNVIVMFLHFEMCHTCLSFFFTIHLLTYTHMVHIR